MMMATEGGIFPRGRGGVDLGSAKGSVFGALHVIPLKFYSSLAHQKMVEGVSKNNNRVLNSMEVIILRWPNW
jgi:hypothetical protein